MGIPTINMVATGHNINVIRKNAGITVHDIQRTVGVTQPAIYKWLRGEAMPTLDNLVILAAMLEVGLDDIVVTDRPPHEVKTA